MQKPSVLAWPGPLARMEPSQRHLVLALAASVLLHALLLMLHFGLPGAHWPTRERALDVVLVNSKSAAPPSLAQALAQANLDGGGNSDEDRRASTPLPASLAAREGNAVVEARRRVARLESRQQQLLTEARSTRAVRPEPRRGAPQPAPQPAAGIDLASNALAMIRLEAQIDKRLEDYNKRPRVKNIGARTREYRYAQYVEDWRQKVERVGNLNYPDSARGRLYGSLVITVVIKSDGTLERVEVNRPSGHKLLDDAARRIVQLAAPFAPFPPDIRRDTDVIEITRTWTFTSADKLQAE
ncbi:MAG TPA: energy transducer TonB [Rhodocyclaceae bacterium]|nr:energy transducer TonB [Rhodocyclaceae bacterium]